MFWKSLIVMMVAAVFALGGCKKKNPCEQLAEKFCADLGGDSEMCKEMKEEAPKASDDDKKECEEMLSKYDETIKMFKALKEMDTEGEGEAEPPAEEKPAP